MITYKTAKLASNIAVGTTQNIVLVPKQNSLLANLINSAIHSQFNKSKEPIVDKNYSEISESICCSLAYLDVEKKHAIDHDGMISNYITDLSRIMSQHLSYANSVVNTEVHLFRDELNALIESRKISGAESLFSVEYYDLPSVFKSVSLDSMIRSIVDKGRKEIVEPMPLTGIGEQIKVEEYLLTGDAEFDRYIIEWIGITGNNLIINNIINHDRYEVLTNSLERNIDFALSNFLFFTNLESRTDVNIGLGANVLRRQASFNRAYFAVMLDAGLNAYEQAIRNKVLFSQETNVRDFSYLSSNDFRVVIYNESFSQFAEEGGDIDTIFGFLSSNQNFPLEIKYEEILEDQELHRKNWEVIQSLKTISDIRNRLTVFKTAITQVFDNRLEVYHSEEERNYHQSTVGYHEKVRYEAYRFIDDIYIEDLEDIDTIILKLVAGIKYGYTNAYPILKEMNSYLKSDERISPQDAAAMVLTRYLVEFLMSQVNVLSH